MEQRITRAKRAIAQSGAEFETPGPLDRAQRLRAVLAMIYLVFNEGYSSDVHVASDRDTLAQEAIRLGRLLAGLFPSEPEVLGLLALMLFQHARAPARFDASGKAVLLDEQDRRLWLRPLIDEATVLLEKAARHANPGLYQLQAAIAAAHCRSLSAAATDWTEIELLYIALERMNPSPVITLNRAVAVSKLRGASEALQLIDPLAAQLSGYFYFHGVRGVLLKELGQTDSARECFDRAIGLATTAAEAGHIRQQLDALDATSRA
jgi:RNA polymerase sigma-70 factor (ECF subfamily)